MTLKSNMALKRLYIPITSTSLAHFFGAGLIMPPALYSKSIEKAQKIDHSLILTEDRFSLDCNCSLEVLLTQADLPKLKKFDVNAYLYDSCIPVTRILNIYFRDMDQLKTTVWNIGQGTAFIPDRLLKVSNDDNKPIDFKFNFEINQKLSLPDLTEKYNRFNVLLGGLAFMRVAYDNSYDYSENYFATLAYFSKTIADQVAVQKSKGLYFDDKFIDLFTSKDSKWSKWRNYIYKGVYINDVEKLAKEENIRIPRSLSGFNMSAIDRNTVIYDIALLASYGDNKPKSLDELVQFLFSNDFSPSKIEEIALLFGLQTGYTKLRNKYKNRNKEVDVKFKFESQLDYSIVEGIYDFVFYGKNNGLSFSELNQIFPQVKKVPVNNSGDSFTILDAIGKAKKKYQDQDAFSNISEDSFFEKLSKMICTWGIPYASQADMLANTSRFLKDNFGKDLRNLIEYEKSKIVSSDSPNNRILEKNTPIHESRPEQNDIITSLPEVYETKTWAELKKTASSKGITISRGKKGTIKDMKELIEKIEMTKTLQLP
jgi:hypothetical protein